MILDDYYYVYGGEDYTDSNRFSVYLFSHSYLKARMVRRMITNKMRRQLRNSLRRWKRSPLRSNSRDDRDDDDSRNEDYGRDCNVMKLNWSLIDVMLTMKRMMKR